VQDYNYYRLQQIDQDNKFIYSKILLLKNPHPPGSGFTVLSNPFGDNLDIAFGQSPVGRVKIRLLDMAGKELLRQEADGKGLGRMRIGFSGNRLSAGIYLLEVTYNGTRYTEKLLKK
jgi:hypothetical protein